MLRRAVVVACSALVLVPALAGARAGAAPAASAPPPAQPPAVAPPPDLLRLEQAMLALPLTSERFSGSVSIAATGVPSGPLGPFAGLSRVLARAAASTAIITISGEESFSPLQASFRISLGPLKLEGRLIGTTLYVEEPFISSFDGHRPWVVEPNQHVEQAVGVELGTLGGKPGSPATEAFGGLVEELGHASSIRELGAQTVDGQATSGFDAIVDPTAVGVHSQEQTRALRKLVKPQAHIEVFIAEDGVPVRTVLRLAIREAHPVHHAELITQEDTLAINVPVTVVAPPADQTITKAQLEHDEAAQFAQLLRSLRRRGEGPRSLTG